ncbi:ferric reductase-like transmembrane domain-containing protein [Kribbella antibiotica]|uniref:ferric reductase-like transmembrane domain-containing protein n=1 Tax=Kribbella antibiotica TaxID=190195 RepID=UPI001EDDC6EC|nr:ferric reductase-like transmembrane domain-containing protein [Kribbella antibiotica]
MGLMSLPEAVVAAGFTGNDNGVRSVVAFSARLAYLTMCLTLCWGIFTATGWIRRFTGHQALRSGHAMLATFTLATATVHGFGFMFLDEQLVVGAQVVVPFLNGYVRHALGIIAFDLMVAIMITSGMHRLFRYRNWLRFHQTAYVVFVLGVAHAWWGAWANGNFELLWLAGLTISAPAIALLAVRFLPARALVRIGLIEGDNASAAPIDKAAPLSISVDNQRCHRYGFCQSEAPDVFQLGEDGRLAYRQSPEVSRNLDVISAARSCPMRAIEIVGKDS